MLCDSIYIKSRSSKSKLWELGTLQRFHVNHVGRGLQEETYKGFGDVLFHSATFWMLTP